MGTTENITLQLLEVPQRVIDSESVTIISDYFYDYGEDEWEDLEYEDEEGMEHAEQETKEPDEIDIFAELLTQFRDKRATKAEEEKGKLRELIGIKTVRDESEETLITPEEISTTTTESSTESFIHPCLRDIDISDSQLKLQNLYTSYPVPDDPGVVPAFWTIQEHRPSYSDDYMMKYFDLSRASGIKPIQSLENMLLSDRINLQYYGINSRILRPLCDTLITNSLVQMINLTGNWLSEDACYHLSDLLRKNNVIRILVLTGCKIGPKGAAKLKGGISENSILTNLDLSDCNIRNEGFAFISEAIQNNDSIHTLSLNNNHLDEACCEDLQKMLAGSKNLKHLQLSWNSLYTALTWKNLIKGLESNKSLIELDLSWNALGKECVPHLRQFLSRSSPLKILHLNGNRFNDDDLPGIARGLAMNEVLEELYLGNNPIRVRGVLVLLTAITPEKITSPPLDIALRLLDLTNIWANKEILQKLEILQHTMPWLDIKLGGILSNYKLVGPDVKAILLRRANYEAMKPKRKRQRKNFGHFVLTLSENPISKGKFVEMIQKFRLKLSKTLIQELMVAFASTATTVDQGLLKSVYLSHYPNTKPPLEKSGKKKKGKKRGSKILKQEETDENQED